MELAQSVASVTKLDEQIEAEIQKIQVTVNQLPHLRKMGAVSGWDEINKSATLARRSASIRGAGNQVEVRSVEQQLQSAQGFLVGRPDYFSVSGNNALLLEYKSGAIRESDGQPLSTYLDQLTFYAVLIFDNFAVDHVVARLESLFGDFFECVIQRQEAKEFAAHVAGAINELNAGTRQGWELNELARPSKEGCSFCEARVICPAFKREQDGLDLNGEQFLIEGFVTDLVQNAVAAVTKVTIADDYRKSTVTITMPTGAVMDVTAHRRNVFVNLRRHGAALAWGHTSRVLSYG